VESGRPILSSGMRRRRPRLFMISLPPRSSSTRCSAGAPVPGAARYEVDVNFSQDFAPGSRVCCSSSYDRLRVSRPPKCCRTTRTTGDSSRNLRAGRASGPAEPRSKDIRQRPAGCRRQHQRSATCATSSAMAARSRPAGRPQPRNRQESVPGAIRHDVDRSGWGRRTPHATGPRLASSLAYPDSRDGVDAPGCTDRNEAVPRQARRGRDGAKLVNGTPLLRARTRDRRHRTAGTRVVRHYTYLNDAFRYGATSASGATATTVRR